MNSKAKLGMLVVLVGTGVFYIYFKTSLNEKRPTEVEIFEKSKLKATSTDTEKIIKNTTSDSTIYTEAKGAQAPHKNISAQQIKLEFEDCFKNLTLSKEEKTEAGVLAEAELKLQTAIKFSEPSIDKEQYTLKNKNNEQLEVQLINSEEEKNKVRVFLISAQDGLPDRIKDFPNSSSATQQRLIGALSLGEIVQQTLSSRQVSAEGEILEIEKSKTETLSIHYSASKKEFLCSKSSCKCVIK